MVRKTGIVMLILLGIMIRVKADTIDYWHVYYNDRKIKEYHDPTSNGKTILETTRIKSADSLTVTYFRDTPCYDCITHVDAEDDKHMVVSSSKGIGTSNPIRLSVDELFKQHVKSGKETYIYYYEEPLINKLNKHLLFKISFE